MFWGDEVQNWPAVESLDQYSLSSFSSLFLVSPFILSLLMTQSSALVLRKSFWREIQTEQAGCGGSCL